MTNDEQLIERLQASLKAAVADVNPAGDLLGPLREEFARGHRRSVGRRRLPALEKLAGALRAATVLAIFAAGMTVFVVFVLLLGHNRSRPSAAPSTHSSVRAIFDRTISVRSDAVDLAPGDRALWVVGFGEVSRLDPASGRLVARISTPGTGQDSQIALGDGSVWVTAGIRRPLIYRIDPATDRVTARVHVPGLPSGIAVGGGAVWVTVIPRSGPGDLVQINPRTDRVLGAPVKVGPGPGQVVYADGALWVADTSPFSVLRVEPSTGHVTTAVGTSPGPAGDFGIGSIGLSFGSLWVASNDSLTRIDPHTLRVIATVPIPRADLIAFADGVVWVFADPRSSSSTRYYPIKGTAALWELDPKSDRIVGTPLHLNAVEPIALAASGRNVWLADYIRGTVTRVRLLPDSRR